MHRGAGVIPAPPEAIFEVLCDPQGHVAIDSSGMLHGTDGQLVSAVGDAFVVHMDREALNDFPMETPGNIGNPRVRARQAHCLDGSRADLPADRHGYGFTLEPTAEGTVVTSFYDWSRIDDKWREAGIFPVIS